MNTLGFLVLSNMLSLKARNLLSHYSDLHEGEEYIYIIAMLLTDLDLSDLDRNRIRGKLINMSDVNQGVLNETQSYY